jgi:hypothetical protein
MVGIVTPKIETSIVRCLVVEIVELERWETWCLGRRKIVQVEGWKNFGILELCYQFVLILGIGLAP